MTTDTTEDTPRKVCVFIFRRDLRLFDNSAWIDALKWCRDAGDVKILPIFIFRANQMDPAKNRYYCAKQVEFMMQALCNLSDEIKSVHVGSGGMVFMEGSDCAKVLEDMIHRNSLQIACVAFNADVTPFARARDDGIRRWCERNAVECIAREDDYTLLPLDKIKSAKGTPFDLFVPYWRKAMHAQVKAPAESALECVARDRMICAADDIPESMRTESDSIFKENLEGFTAEVVDVTTNHRRDALDILERARRGAFRSYRKHHDDPGKDDVATTRLSKYIKFGCVSIREVYATLKLAYGKSSRLVENLFLREFNYNMAHTYPNEILRGMRGSQTNACIHSRYEKAESKYNRDEDAFARWSSGTTGVPIVDAAMRSLIETGWINNKMRMVTAMFLSRDLNFDWRRGEEYFATRLIDYDPILNNAGWMELLRHKRPMNPYKIAAKVDPQCVFIKRWVPELADVPILDIIAWFDACRSHPALPQPMIAVQGCRIKMKTYVSDYVRPKINEKKKKTSKYSGGAKNVAKYDKESRLAMKQRRVETL